MAPQYSAPIGTRDIVPPESARWRELVTVFADVVSAAGYGQVILPMFEDLAVFHRVGESTDVVTKEMYDFRDKGDRHLALRPEQTASVARSFAQHRPVTPWKVWYSGPNFRYEKAQKGRYRQFDQVGVELIGVDDPFADVEVIALASRFYGRLGLRRVRLVLNSLGDAEDRVRYREALSAYWTANLDGLTVESRQTAMRNPMRVLDSKRAEDAPVVAGAPLASAFLSDEAFAAFEVVQRGLRALDIDFALDPRLVRGLDYYRRTTFEFAGQALEGAQNAVGGGGRYDGLVEDLGGPAVAGIGFALGVDRTLLACDAEGVFGAPACAVDCFVVDACGGFDALMISEELRLLGVSADRAFDNRSMKSQLKAADRSGARFALLIGADELARAVVTIRTMRGGGDQVSVPRDQIVEHMRKLLS